jgi:hypothetical protein
VRIRTDAAPAFVHDDRTMNNLVHCPCGHALDRHVAEGCLSRAGDPACRCKRSEYAALEDAVDAVRTTFEDDAARSLRSRR